MPSQILENTNFPYNNNNLELMRISGEGFKFIIEALDRPDVVTGILQHGSKSAKFKSNELRLLTPAFVRDYFHRQQQRLASQKNTPQTCTPDSVEESWQPNQLKVFTWTLLAYSYSKHKNIEELDSHDQEQIQGLFPRKGKDFVRYNIQALGKHCRQDGRVWKPEQVDLLIDIIKSNEFGRRWSDIAYILYLRSDRAFFKTSHQCREKWFNHLNPALNKEKWTLEEDVTLFKLAKELDTKWAKISREMGEYRTEHMVKNRFKSIFKKYESRFQRCTTRKRIENILKDLQGKLENQADSQVECQGVKEESVSCQARGPADVAIQIAPCVISSEPQQQFHKISVKEEDIEAQHFEFAEDRFHLVQADGLIMTQGGSVLIDYTNMDFEVLNKTIFSGSVE